MGSLTEVGEIPAISIDRGYTKDSMTSSASVSIHVRSNNIKEAFEYYKLVCMEEEKRAKLEHRRKKERGKGH